MRDFLKYLENTVGRIVNIWILFVFLSSQTVLTFFIQYYLWSAVSGICLLILLLDIYSKNKRYKKRVDFIQNKIINYEKSLGLSHKGTCINSSKRVWKKRKTIFWPVLPSEDPNLVHFAFINTLKILLNNGFDVHVHVYDMYYIKRMKSEKSFDNEKALRKNIDKFEEFLKDHGIKSSMFNGKVTYVKESKSVGRKYYRNYSAVCSRLKLLDLKIILDKKDHDKNSLLRLLKPISIIAFMATLEQKFFKRTVAITLSGYDEEILYSKCKHTIENLYDGFVPFQMFIPIFSGFSSKAQPGVIDSRYRLTSDNLDNLVQLAEGHDYKNVNENDPLNFIINMLIFSHGENVLICIKDNSESKQSSVLKKVCSADCKDFNSCVMNNALKINMVP